ncbi:MAG: hypothetical protein WEB58_12840 [Planctomycetaceae bacterium]
MIREDQRFVGQLLQVTGCLKFIQHRHDAVDFTSEVEIDRLRSADTSVGFRLFSLTVLLGHDRNGRLDPFNERGVGSMQFTPLVRHPFGQQLGANPKVRAANRAFKDARFDIFATSLSWLPQCPFAALATDPQAE